MLALRLITPTNAKLEALRTVMRRYMSPIMVESVLSKAIAKLGIPAEQLQDADLEAVLEDAMVGLRLFVQSSQLADLMAALTDILVTQPSTSSMPAPAATSMTAPKPLVSAPRLETGRPRESRTRLASSPIPGRRGRQ